MTNFNGPEYKRITKRICDKRIKSPSHIDRPSLNKLLVLNIKKANDLCNSEWSLPDDLMSLLDSKIIHLKEYDLIETKNKISVLNTSLFCILHQNDYAIPDIETNGSG